jgi:hypothetical protein
MPATALSFVRVGAGDPASAATGTDSVLIAVPYLGNEAVGRGGDIAVTLPEATFTHSNSAATITVTARQNDGRPLPGWLRFDPLSGRLSGKAPPGFTGTVKVQIIARDTEGQEARTQLQIDIGRDTAPRTGTRPETTTPERRTSADLPAARAGLSEQLQQAGQRGALSPRLAALSRSVQTVTRHG